MNKNGLDKELDEIRGFLRKREKSRQKALDECYYRAVDDFNRMANHIIEKYNPWRIWQWGSLLNRRKFSEISDIDIALEGLCSFDEYADIVADLSVMTQFSLDIVEIERIGEENANHIRTYGRMVYERTGHRRKRVNQPPAKTGTFVGHTHQCH